MIARVLAGAREWWHRLRGHRVASATPVSPGRILAHCTCGGWADISYHRGCTTQTCPGACECSGAWAVVDEATCPIARGIMRRAARVLPEARAIDPADATWRRLAARS